LVVTQTEVKDKAQLEALVEARLIDMGLGIGDREYRALIWGPAKQYYLSLVEEDLANTEDVLLNECLESAEGMTLGFIAGYDACLRNQS
jgi:hypothetical protein